MIYDRKEKPAKTFALPVAVVVNLFGAGLNYAMVANNVAKKPPNISSLIEHLWQTSWPDQ